MLNPLKHREPKFGDHLSPEPMHDHIPWHEPQRPSRSMTTLRALEIIRHRFELARIESGSQQAAADDAAITLTNTAEAA